MLRRCRADGPSRAKSNDILPALPRPSRLCPRRRGAAYALGPHVSQRRDLHRHSSLRRLHHSLQERDGSGLHLEPDWKKLFNADNDKRTNEIIFAFASDAVEAVTWGGGTYLICGSVGSDNGQNGPDYGINTGWSNFRSTGAFYDIFDGNRQSPSFLHRGAGPVYHQLYRRRQAGLPICASSPTLPTAARLHPTPLPTAATRPRGSVRPRYTYGCRGRRSRRQGGMSADEARGLVNQHTPPRLQRYVGRHRCRRHDSRLLHRRARPSSIWSACAAPTSPLRPFHHRQIPVGMEGRYRFESCRRLPLQPLSHPHCRDIGQS